MASFKEFMKTKEALLENDETTITANSTQGIDMNDSVCVPNQSRKFNFKRQQKKTIDNK